jgi:hypothetical protein
MARAGKRSPRPLRPDQSDQTNQHLGASSPSRRVSANYPNMANPTPCMAINAKKLGLIQPMPNTIRRWPINQINAMVTVSTVQAAKPGWWARRRSRGRGCRDLIARQATDTAVRQSTTKTMPFKKRTTFGGTSFTGSVIRIRASTTATAAIRIIPSTRFKVLFRISVIAGWVPTGRR